MNQGMEGGIPPYLPNLNTAMRIHDHLKFAACLIVLMLSGCEKNPIDEAVNNSDGQTKIVYTKAGADVSSLIFKLAEADDVTTLETIEAKGLSNYRKLFRSTPGKEELERRFGLDRWYIADVRPGMDIGKVAESVASITSVATVEYNVRFSKASDCKVYPLTEEETHTKSESDGLPFNDPSLINQWHYYNQGNASVASSAKKGADINVIDVWRELTCGDPSIIVAVVDEGVKYSHPDLAANMWKNVDEIPENGIDDDGNGYIDDVYGYNFVDDGAISWDKKGDSGHGTHCAGTIAAVNNNKTGVAGVAGGSGNGDGCRIMSCQIFSGGGGGSVSSTVNAIKYAADNGASIISCSFGYTMAFSSDNAYIKSQGSAEIDAIHYFEACDNNDVLDGNIAIFASGNEAHDYAHYPGAFHDIISVTAFGPDYLPTYYTNYGPGCNICAPGGEAYLPPWKSYKALVLSTIPSEIEGSGESTVGKGHDYGYMQGTSMACPHVSGVVALAMSYSKKIGRTFGREEFKQMILASSNDMDTKLKGTKKYQGRSDLNLGQFYHKLGTGSIDAWLLMMKIEGTPYLIAETGKNQWLDISDYFGGASVSLTYSGVEVSDQTRESLGLAEEPYIQYGRLYIHPTKAGSGKVRIKAVGGGDIIGGGDNVGGMEITQEVSIIARSFKSTNGGWI